MSTADIDLLGPPQADDLMHPEFAVVLRGYDPEEVRGYVASVANTLDTLQHQLEEAHGQIDTARRQYMAAREAAYKQLATQMAELLHTADQEAERLRREGAEEAARQREEAARRASSMQREAEENAETLRREGEEMLYRARAETDRVLGGLAVRRDEMLTELDATRSRLTTILTQIDQTIAVTREEAQRALTPAAIQVEETEEADGPADPAGSAGNGEDQGGDHAEAPPVKPVARPPRTDDLLDSIEGFDLVLPDVRLEEDGA